MVISLNSLQWHDITVTFGEGNVHCFDKLKGSDAVIFRLWKLFLISPDNFSQIYISVYMCAAQIWLESLNESDRTVLRQVMEIKLSSLGIFEPKMHEYNHHWLHWFRFRRCWQRIESFERNSVCTRCTPNVYGACSYRNYRVWFGSYVVPVADWIRECADNDSVRNSFQITNQLIIIIIIISLLCPQYAKCQMRADLQAVDLDSKGPSW